MQMSLVAVILPATVLTLPSNCTCVGREAQRAHLSIPPTTRAELATAIQPRDRHSFSSMCPQQQLGPALST